MAARHRGNQGNGAGTRRGSPAAGRRSARHAGRDTIAPFVDSHAHLADPAFEPDRSEVIARARAAGAQAVVCIGESIDAAARAAALARQHPRFIWHTAGMHPHDAKTFDPIGDIESIRASVGAGAVAIGECGLDYHYDHSPRDRQRRAFSAQLALARELDRPVVVHTRDAEDDTGAMVTEAGRAGVVGVLHCYTGSSALAERAVSVGWYVSFSGIITFKHWQRDDVLRLVPADRLLVESDAPYLAPVPNRGKRNEPAWVGHTLERAAAVRGVDAEELAKQTSANAKRLFALE